MSQMTQETADGALLAGEAAAAEEQRLREEREEEAKKVIMMRMRWSTTNGRQFLSRLQ